MFHSKTNSIKVKQTNTDDEYKKNPAIKRDDIRYLRKWLETQPHLPNKYITDLDLILAYHCCDFSMEVTKRILDLNFTQKTLFHNLFSNRVVDERCLRALNTILWKPMPARSREGYACLYGCFLDSSPKSLVTADVMKALLMIMDLWQYEDGTWPGLILIFDMKGLRAGHVACFDYVHLQQSMGFIQDVIAKLKANSAFFEAEGLKRVCESRRPGKPKTVSDFFGGVEGSFKKLDID